MVLCFLSYLAGIHNIQVEYEEKADTISKNSTLPIQKKIYVETESEMGLLVGYDEQNKLVSVDRYPLSTFNNPLGSKTEYSPAGATGEEIEKTPEPTQTSTEATKSTQKPVLEQETTKDVHQSKGTLVGSDFKLYHYAPTGNATASGRMPVVGTTVAVDPRYIKLGTYLRIEIPDGNGGYKVYRSKARADDTGGAIKGHVIDVFVGSQQEALNLGVIQNARIYLIGEQK